MLCISMLPVFSIPSVYAWPAHCMKLEWKEFNSCMKQDSEAQGYYGKTVYTYKEYIIMSIWAILLLIILIGIYNKIWKSQKNKYDR